MVTWVTRLEFWGVGTGRNLKVMTQPSIYHRMQGGSLIHSFIKCKYIESLLCVWASQVAQW